MSSYSLGWAKVMAEGGPDFIAWLKENKVLRDKITIHAKAVTQLLLGEVDTEIAARKFWCGVPRALNHECPDTMHKDWGIVRAYVWLHFLERYARTWSALEYLVEEQPASYGQGWRQDIGCWRWSGTCRVCDTRFLCNHDGVCRGERATQAGTNHLTSPAWSEQPDLTP